MDRFQLPADHLLAALSRAPVPISLLNALRSLADVRASVDLFVASDRGLLQIVVDGRRVMLTGAARDAVLTLLGQGARSALERDTAAGGTSAGGLLDPSTAARVASVGAQVQESRLLAALPQAEEAAADAEVVAADAEQPATVLPIPLMETPTIDDAAKNLARAIDSSGLFLEAHFAQFLRGQRSLRQIEDETRSLPVDPQGASAAVSERRSAMQFDALQRQTISLVGQAWTGQPFRIEIEADRERNREAANSGDATGLFVATLTMRLPNLGRVQARIRVMQSTVGVQIESERPTALAAELPHLASALSARGLSLAQLTAAPQGVEGQ